MSKLKVMNLKKSGTHSWLSDSEEFSISKNSKKIQKINVEIEILLKSEIEVKNNKSYLIQRKDVEKIWTESVMILGKEIRK